MNKPADGSTRRRLRRVLVVLPALLVGCGPLEVLLAPPKPPPSAEERTETEEARLPPPEEAAPPEAPVPRPRERPPVPRRGIEPDPDQLIGLSQAETEALLGVPKWKEEAAPAEVWHYASGNCTLKVFFYLDLASSTYRALVYEVKDHDESDHAKRLCFAQILAQADKNG